MIEVKEYDVIVLGSGSAMEIVNVMEQETPDIRVAVIDKDEPGGICLTRGCIPSKILLYSAEIVRTVERANEFGISVDLKNVDFHAVMERMRKLIKLDMDAMKNGLTHAKNLDYYQCVAEFIAPYTMKVGEETIKSQMIFLCTGSKPLIPAIEGLEKIAYHTSDTVLKMDRLPGSIAVVGGGYIAAEYGHFFSAMGSEVTVIGRNRQFLPEEEPEVSALAKKELQEHITILSNHEVRSVENTSAGGKRLVAVNRETGKEVEVATVDLRLFDELCGPAGWERVQ